MPRSWTTFTQRASGNSSTSSGTWDKIPDTEVLAQTGLPSIYTTLMQYQLRWTGHVACMPDHRLPKRLLYGELQQGKRVPWWPEETLQRHTEIIPESVWHQPWLLGTNCHGPGFTGTPAVHKGSERCEANRTTAAEQIRQARKAWASNPQGSNQPHPLPPLRTNFSCFSRPPQQSLDD